MSLPRRLGRFARGFVAGVSEDSHASSYDPAKPSFEDYLRTSRRRSENLKDALGVAWRSASEEWRIREEQRIREEAEEREAYEREMRDRGSFGSPSSGYEQRPPGFGERMRERVRDRVRDDSQPFIPKKYSPEVLKAYDRLDLLPGTEFAEVDRKRREMVKKFHPDRFTDPDKRLRAERVTAEINAAYDLIKRSAGR